MRLTARERTAYTILRRLDDAPNGLTATELTANGYVARDMRDAMVCGGYLRIEPFIGLSGTPGRRYFITSEGRLRLKYQRRTLERKAPPPEPDDEEE